MVYAHVEYRLAPFYLRNAAFAFLQSAPPRNLGVASSASSLKIDLRYTPSDCFETFPFP